MTASDKQAFERWWARVREASAGAETTACLHSCFLPRQMALAAWEACIAHCEGAGQRLEPQESRL